MRDPWRDAHSCDDKRTARARRAHTSHDLHESDTLPRALRLTRPSRVRLLAPPRLSSSLRPARSCRPDHPRLRPRCCCRRYLRPPERRLSRLEARGGLRSSPQATLKMRCPHCQPPPGGASLREMHKSSEPDQYETRLWQRSGTGRHVIDEFAMYMRLLGWRQRAEYHREASEGAEESEEDAEHEASASAGTVAGQTPRPSIRHPHGLLHGSGRPQPTRSRRCSGWRGCAACVRTARNSRVWR